MLNEIFWPYDYLPGTTDNFSSNEIIVKGITAGDVFENLVDTSKWSTFYEGAPDVVFHNGGGPVLFLGARFSYKTLELPMEAEVVEFEPPEKDRPGRLSWHGWASGDAEQRLDVLHAWLFENMVAGRVRILTQESQKGAPAKDLFNASPDMMNQTRQEWVKGLARVVVASKSRRANKSNSK